LGIYAGTQEVLAGANYIDVIVAWCTYCIDSGIGNCAFHIYYFLKLLTDSLLTSTRVCLTWCVKYAPGVIIHVHDIFLPEEYPWEMVIDENRSWNEQYLLRALVAVVFGLQKSSSKEFVKAWITPTQS